MSTLLEVICLTAELTELWRSYNSTSQIISTQVAEDKAKALVDAVNAIESGDAAVYTAVDALEGHKALLRIVCAQTAFWDSMGAGPDAWILARRGLMECMSDLESLELTDTWRNMPIYRSALFDTL